MKRVICVFSIIFICLALTGCFSETQPCDCLQNIDDNNISNEFIDIYRIDINGDTFYSKMDVIYNGNMLKISQNEYEQGVEFPFGKYPQSNRRTLYITQNRKLTAFDDNDGIFDLANVKDGLSYRLIYNPYETTPEEYYKSTVSFSLDMVSIKIINERTIVLKNSSGTRTVTTDSYSIWYFN